MIILTAYGVRKAYEKNKERKEKKRRLLELTQQQQQQEQQESSETALNPTSLKITDPFLEPFASPNPPSEPAHPPSTHRPTESQNLSLARAPSELSVSSSKRTKYNSNTDNVSLYSQTSSTRSRSAAEEFRRYQQYVQRQSDSLLRDMETEREKPLPPPAYEDAPGYGYRHGYDYVVGGTVHELPILGTGNEVERVQKREEMELGRSAGIVEAKREGEAERSCRLAAEIPEPLRLRNESGRGRGSGSGSVKMARFEFPEGGLSLNRSGERRIEDPDEVGSVEEEIERWRRASSDEDEDEDDDTRKRREESEWEKRFEVP